MMQIMKNRTPTRLATAAVVGFLAAACAGYTAKLATITVRPDANLAVNSSQQFVAEGWDARGATFPIAPVWAVVASGGTIDNQGLFTAGSMVGTFPNTVAATDGSISGNASVIVRSPASPALASITATPAGPDTIPASTTRQFLAEGRDANGYHMASFSPTWSVVAGGGTINNAGLFTAGTLPGNYANTIKASSGNVAGYTTVTVTSSAASLATMQELVHFAYDKSDLTEASREALDGKVRVFRANPAMRILIVGHTDSRGTDAYNLALGTRRAEGRSGTTWSRRAWRPAGSSSRPAASRNRSRRGPRKAPWRRIGVTRSSFWWPQSS